MKIYFIIFLTSMICCETFAEKDSGSSSEDDVNWKKVAKRLKLLETEVADLRGQVTRLNTRVSFHATGLCAECDGIERILVFRDVKHNDGEAYDVNSGVFMVPYSGYYLLHASLASNSTTEDDPNIIFGVLRVDGEDIIVQSSTSPFTPFGDGFEFSVTSVTMATVARLKKGTGVYVQAQVHKEFVTLEEGRLTNSFSASLLYLDDDEDEHDSAPEDEEGEF